MSAAFSMRFFACAKAVVDRQNASRTNRSRLSMGRSLRNVRLPGCARSPEGRDYTELGSDYIAQEKGKVI